MHKDVSVNPGPNDYAKSSGRDPGKQASTLTAQQIERVIAYIRTSSNSPLSDEAKILLSFYAGLRASEIATLTMSDVCDAEGRIGGSIVVRAANAKNGKTRTIPMHPRIEVALTRLRSAHPDVPFIAFSNFHRVKKQSVTSVTLWFHRLYKTLGLEGCSSHSGRRTFITNLARKANQFNKSLRDVQRLAGHARLDTTERYIDPSDDLAGLIGSLGEEKPAQRGASNKARS